MQKKQYIDHPSLEKLSLAMSAERFKSFKQVAIASLKDLSEQLSEALANKDGEQLHRAAHSIKSSAHYMGGLGISEQARLLELQLKNHDMLNTEQAVTALQKDLAAFIIELDNYISAHSHDAVS